jgi:hypothetical protein
MTKYNVVMSCRVGRPVALAALRASVAPFIDDPARLQLASVEQPSWANTGQVLADHEILEYVVSSTVTFPKNVSADKEV